MLSWGQEECHAPGRPREREDPGAAQSRGSLKQVLLFVGIGFFASLLVVARVSWRRLHDPEVRAPAAGQTALARPQGSRTIRPGPSPIDLADLDRLRSRSLGLPLEGMKAADLRDNFTEARAGHVHEALDILAPRGTKVLAVDAGRVAKLFDSVRGGLTVYQFDPTLTFCYYYAHLDRYAPGLAEGDELRQGSLVGYVGTTGNAPRDTPHLHFTVFKLGPEKRWGEGTPINPFPLWDPRPLER